MSPLETGETSWHEKKKCKSIFVLSFWKRKTQVTELISTDKATKRVNLRENISREIFLLYLIMLIV